MKTKLLLAGALVALAAFNSCKSDNPITPEPTPTPQKKNEISIAKPAELTATSGGFTLGTTKGTRAIDNGSLIYYKKADCPDLYKDNFPEQKLHKEECEHVYSCIKEDCAAQAAGGAAIYEVDKNSFPKKEFYIVSAYSSKDHDAKGGHSSVAGDMHDLQLNGVKIKEFNTNTCVAADLVITTDGLKEVTYYDSFGEKKALYPVTDWKLYFIPDYGYYVGMNYHSEKTGSGDGDYSDWVVKFIPAEKSDPSYDTDGAVEVNLSLNDKKDQGDYIATKLSIHVRALTDVEVFIPVDKKYYCLADDMDISISHRQADVIYNTDPQFVEMKIGTNVVTFKVAYEDEGIYVTTKGINKEVLNLCGDMYGDGVTFEIWNYFKDITRPDLKLQLDKATVTFHGNSPKTYINAFAKLDARGYEGPVYNKFNDKGQLVPYTDAECTQPLDTKYWTRINPDDKDYVFLGALNPNDCQVKPTDTTYKPNSKDVTDPTLPNYNVEYTK